MQGFILKVEPIEIAEGQDVEGEGKGKSKATLSFWPEPLGSRWCHEVGWGRWEGNRIQGQAEFGFEHVWSEKPPDL